VRMDRRWTATRAAGCLRGGASCRAPQRVSSSREQRVRKGLADEHRPELAACAKDLWGRVYAFAMLVTCGDHALAQDAMPWT